MRGGIALCGLSRMEKPQQERLQPPRFSILSADIPSEAKARKRRRHIRPGQSRAFQNDALVPCRKRQQGDVPGLLDGAGQAALVRSADAGEAPGHDLAALRHKTLQQANVAVRDGVNLLRAELADLLAAEELSTTARSTRGPASRTALWTAAAGAGSWAGTGTRAGTGFRRCMRCAQLGRPSRSFFRHSVSSLLSSVPVEP
jgi:hypothetical protein